MSKEIEVAATVELLVWEAEQAAERLESYRQKESLNSDTLRELRYGNLNVNSTNAYKPWVCVGNWYIKLSPPEVERLLMQNQAEIQVLKKESKQDLLKAQQALQKIRVEN
uniref:P53 and DNA damage-regulated protein 1 n=1 Tax=Aplanochytrium stocchinoi TaxID=215587 RepID=A0A6S8E4M6_9STRA|mmetsp:Transcript_1785/g.2135  ORF Transcript_1785/g.2135 Transcript_1785/m.2135 type:complete len:110 (+) Transcript_1785:199-528(+)|eukprot:CAMPEP_0204829716 /NCGR_PEP_ID=MMETSP1346-20131115/8024_1 /ASSEMBLY_ACC=CAM_ASM_000771 /TAXON_ID=215587 /ORGANISM="Aplanochytrium stocchinoi, Strain GSBS06" /LENGTH=109 /DNA_ID=CAMNT_0051959737 /DNA_START=166 /DNA_END=495 /DNA_ORIENTATION=-